MKFNNIQKMIIVVVIGISAISVFAEYDNTDDSINGIRSDMKLYTDYGTGCQYIQFGLLGPVMKRIDGNGKHVGCE